MKNEIDLFLYELDGHGYSFEDKTWIDGHFADIQLNMAWEMWCASASREGYKLVPVEPTDKMQKHGNRLALADKGYRYDCASIWEAMIGASE